MKKPKDIFRLIDVCNRTQWWQPEGPKCLIRNITIGHDPEPVLSSHPYEVGCLLGYCAMKSVQKFIDVSGVPTLSITADEGSKHPEYSRLRRTRGCLNSWRFTVVIRNRISRQKAIKAFGGKSRSPNFFIFYNSTKFLRTRRPVLLSYWHRATSLGLRARSCLLRHESSTAELYST